MEQELRNILIQVAQGAKHYNLAQRQVLNLFGVSGSTFRKDKYGEIYEAKPDEDPCDKCKFTYMADTTLCGHCLKHNDTDSEYYR